MAENTQPSEPKQEQVTELPTPEALQPKSDSGTPTEASTAVASAPSKAVHWPQRGTYRPSFRATLFGLVAVAIVLAINAGVVAFLLHSQSNNKNQSTSPVTISQSSLSKLGVNNTPVGDAGVVLTVSPSTNFSSNVQVAGNVNVAGQLTLNGTFSASSANFGGLQAGNTTLSQLNVNGDGTLSNLNLRNNLIVTGTTTLNGVITANQLLNVDNNLTVSGNLTVGGTMSVASFQTANLTIDGHVVTVGYAPEVSKGSCIGSNGTVSISGNDAAGTVTANVGTPDQCAGILANVVFSKAYSDIPHVVFTPIGNGGLFYVTRSATGFSIGDSSSPAPGGYAFDYIVEQ
jgi:hypothetical protein